MNTSTHFQRALIFQGGGSLGAYEAGVYKATYELLSERDIKLGRQGMPIFHIVAGTSIGAMNAAVLVSYVKENKSWKGSADRLLSSGSICQQNLLWIQFQVLMHGGIIGTILIKTWRQANQQEDTMTQSSSCLEEYQMYLAFLKH